MKQRNTLFNLRNVRRQILLGKVNLFDARNIDWVDTKVVKFVKCKRKEYFIYQISFKYGSTLKWFLLARPSDEVSMVCFTVRFSNEGRPTKFST